MQHAESAGSARMKLVGAAVLESLVGSSWRSAFAVTLQMDVKGEKLGSIDTKMMNNSFASVSSCGRFFGACGKSYFY